jgi:hypothetical protein
MKFKSLSNLWNDLKVVLYRFPTVIALAVAGSIASIFLIETNKDYYQVVNFILICLIGVSFLFAAALFAERKKYDRKTSWLLQLAATVLLIGYYFVLPEKFETPHVIQYCMLFIAVHLLASFIAFAGYSEPQGFWQYNKIIFLRFLLAAFYTGVLYIGITIALLAMQELLRIPIREKSYLEVFVLLSGIFNTIFFLSGISEKLEALNTDYSYPKGLKIFTQYVLLPLVVLYLAILYAYMGKIILEWDLPRGWVAYLIIAFSVVGILALLLIYPIRENEENKWIKTFSRFFYLALFPLVLLLITSIYKRVSEYGITESRYLVLLTAAWLTGISLYNIFSKEKNIKIIPVSLALIILLSSFGPWGAFSVSIRSQKAQLKNLLEKNGLYKENKVIKSKKDLNHDEAERINSLVQFLFTRNKNVLEELYAIDIPDSTDSWEINKVLGITYSTEYNLTDFVFEPTGTAASLGYYQYFSNGNLSLYQNYKDGDSIVESESSKTAIKAGEDSLSFKMKPTGLIKLFINNQPVAEMDLRPKIDSLFKIRGKLSYSLVVAPDSLSWSVDNEKIKIKNIMRRMDVHTNHDTIVLNSIEFNSAFTIKK